MASISRSGTLNLLLGWYSLLGAALSVHICRKLLGNFGSIAPKHNKLVRPRVLPPNHAEGWHGL